MNPRIIRAVSLALALAMPAALQAQTVVPAAAPPPSQDQAAPGQPQQAQQTFSQQEIDALLAPVALYPDELLSQILMASTYPLEVVQAYRWSQDPQHAGLKGDQLAQALEQQDWDPSVKALVPFPTALKMMNDRLDWTQRLGDAFVAQQAAVMDSVQRLRQEAQARGNLQSTPQQVVQDQGGAIAIQPADPNLLYVPYYNPSVVYGDWAYPDYPPYYFAPPVGYYAGPGLFFGVGFGIVSPFWGWNRFDWRDHRVFVDAGRFNSINRFAIDRFHRPAFSGNTWRFDQFHRRGVAFRDPGLRQQFGRPGVGTADQRRDFRGFDRNATGAQRTQAQQLQQRNLQEQNRVQQQQGRIENQQGRIETQQGRIQNQQGRVETQQGRIGQQQGRIETQQGRIQNQQGRIENEQTRLQQQRQAAEASRAQASQQRVQAGPRATASQPANQRAATAFNPSTVNRAAVTPRTAPAFESFNRGATATAQSNRGRVSQQAAAPQVRAAPAAVAHPAPAAHPAAAPSGQKREPSGR